VAYRTCLLQPIGLALIYMDDRCAVIAPTHKPTNNSAKLSVFSKQIISQEMPDVFQWNVVDLEQETDSFGVKNEEPWLWVGTRSAGLAELCMVSIITSVTQRTAPQFRRHAAARRHATARRHFRTCGKIQHCSNCFRKLLRYRFFRDVFVGWKTAAVHCVASRNAGNYA